MKVHTLDGGAEVEVVDFEFILDMGSTAGFLVIGGLALVFVSPLVIFSVDFIGCGLVGVFDKEVLGVDFSATLGVECFVVATGVNCFVAAGLVLVGLT